MMNSPQQSAEDRQHKLAELHELRDRVAMIEQQLYAHEQNHYPPPGFYTAYYATTGFMLGMFGAATSLVFNIIGSLMWTRITGKEQSPLHLIQVYLTFPLGEAALKIDSGLTLAIGCCLYLGTGMVYGMIFQVLLTKWAADKSFAARIVLVSVLSLVVWVVNFYGILSWLQPWLFGGNWIVEMVPWWVAALTHLVFGWTMVLVYPWGTYVPYNVESEQA